MGYIFRQGDLIFKELSGNYLKDGVDSIYPKMNSHSNDTIFSQYTILMEKGYEKLDTTVVAEGEATGHRHTFKSGQVLLFKKKSDNAPSIVLIGSQNSTLTHQQHLSITIPRGLYEIIRERSYDPFSKEEQTVED